MSRTEDIIALVNQFKKIEVNELAERLDVSKVTMRKDLDKLEARGLLHREHGYAVLNSQDDINYRLAQHYDLKRKIALKAAETVYDGDVVMIESGSTCALLAEELAYHRKNVTIITNSCFIASYIRKAPSVKIMLIGGDYQKESQVNVGPLVRRIISEFCVDRLFVGVDGFDYNRGFTGNDLLRAEAAATLAESAKERIVLTDSSKFKQAGMVSEFPFSAIQTVYTDTGIGTSEASFLEKQGIKVIQVS